MAVCGAAIATVAVWWPPDQYDYRGDQRRVYGTETWWLLVLVLAGALAIAFGPALQRAVGAALSAVAALQLAGTGVVAHRRWFTSGGFGSHAANETTLRWLAIALTVATLAIVVSCVSVLFDDGAVVSARARRSIPVIVAGGATAILVPLAMGWEPGARTTQAGAHALMYGLPWGIAIACSAFLRYRERLVTVASLAVSSVPVVLWTPMIPGDHIRLGPLVLIVTLVLTTPIRGQSPFRASRRNSGVSGVGAPKV